MDDSIWKDDGHGIVEAGDVGGDIQVGKAYSRRFVHSRLAGRAITVEVYPDGFWHGIPVNPHPGYEHWSSFCPNCGY